MAAMSPLREWPDQQEQVMNTSVRFAFFGAVLGSLTGIASAAPPGDGVQQRVVAFADLDMTQTAGAAALYARIKYAAQEVCRPANARDLASGQHGDKCRAQAISRAVAHVNSPALTNYHVAKTGTAILMARQP
jgi:UrcA family protein